MMFPKPWMATCRLRQHLFVCTVTGVLAIPSDVSAQPVPMHSPAVLTLVYSTSLSDEFDLRGATVADNGDVVWWSSDAVLHLPGSTRERDAASSTRRVCTSFVERPLAAGFDRSDGSILVFDEDKHIVLSQGPDGVCRIQHSLPRPLQLYVSAADTTVLIGRMHRPFEWWGLMPASGIVLHHVAPGPLARLESASDDWVGLPVIGVSGGYLQTVSDLRSQHRTLVLYDYNGTPTQRHDVSLQMGMIAGSPNGRMLVGLRTTDVQELVVYAWIWHRNQGKE